ncbi:hypothetical protein PCANB_001642 [Pneumocystis canis]|nr:hypothetical protein PCK1_001677 [Pneumocystis canis]KAG5436889.1 hypothetical protein PCANB_001642 [Pneumocystis canis]
MFSDSVLLYVIREKLFYKNSKKAKKKGIWNGFFKGYFCEAIWRIRRIYKAIYRVISRKTSICRILDNYLCLDESYLLENIQERRKKKNFEENERLGNLVWNIYLEICMSVKIYSEWQDLLYRAGYLDSFEETNFIDAVITSILLKKKIKHNYEENALSKQCLCLRYSITGIFCIQKEKKYIMQKCHTQVQYYQNQQTFQEIWDALVIPERAIQNNKKNWVMIGFQGDDPSTDFRSMGVFGLQLLHYFVITLNKYTRIMISESRSDKTNINLPWYSFALAAINILAYIIELMNESRLEKIFIQYYNYGVTVEEIVRQIFCYTFISFHHFWKLQVSTKNVQSVFDFEYCLKRFKKKARDSIELGNGIIGIEN